MRYVTQRQCGRFVPPVHRPDDAAFCRLEWSGKRPPQVGRGNLIAVGRQAGQAGIAQANRIALALAGRRYNPRRDGFENDMRLSGAVQLLARVVESFAHDARCVIVERAVARLEKRQN